MLEVCLSVQANHMRCQRSKEHKRRLVVFYPAGRPGPFRPPGKWFCPPPPLEIVFASPEEKTWIKHWKTLCMVVD